MALEADLGRQFAEEDDSCGEVLAAFVAGLNRFSGKLRCCIRARRGSRRKKHEISRAFNAEISRAFNPGSAFLCIEMELFPQRFSAPNRIFGNGIDRSRRPGVDLSSRKIHPLGPQ
ncbi:MAG TPA: hypothetical protein VHX11_06425, partial [Acidobacteriaceae bacterium]|nr:hypothetical protein [Acidobacteriaceae bacterium]